MIDCNHHRLTELSQAAPPPLLGGMHIWCFSPGWCHANANALRTQITNDEKARATDFATLEDSRKFENRRGFLRIILAKYLRIDPLEIAFAQNSYGKPRLAEPAQARHLAFSSSQSGDFGVVAVTDGHRVGVDVEELRTIPDADQLVTRFFHRSEQSAYAALPAASRQRAFLQTWAAKEAFVKAIGTGMSFPLDRFEVAIHSSAPSHLLRIAGRTEPAQKWRLQQFDPIAGHVLVTAAHSALQRFEVFTLIGE